MSADPDLQKARAETAARWFARLNATSVSNAELAEFRAWRRDPLNAQAYGETERIWRQSAGLQTDPDIRDALHAVAAKSRCREPARNRVVGGGLVMAAVCASVVFLAWYAQRPTVYETAVGEQRSVILDDGSRVNLDTNTRISVRYRKDKRSVTLERGQALFEVVHRLDRPFQVAAGATRIVDLGTQFDVRRDSDQVRVTLLSGSVEVSTSGVRSASWSLAPGQQLVSRDGVAKASKVDARKVTSWTSGHLVFDDIPLSAATAEVNRYGKRKVILDAGSVGDIRISGTFDTSDTEAFVSAVSKLYDLTVRRDGNGSIVLGAASEKPSA